MDEPQIETLEGPEVPRLPPLPLNVLDVLEQAATWWFLTPTRRLKLGMAAYHLELLYDHLLEHADELDNLQYWMDRT